MSRIARVIPVVMGTKSYINKIKTLFGSSLIAYYPMNETSGTVAVDASGNGRNGAYTGVDLANTAGPAGTKTRAPYFDGANDYVDIFSAGLASAFSKTEGTIFMWAKVYNAGVWTDATIRRAASIRQDANNRITMNRPGVGADNKLVVGQVANNVAGTITYTTSAPVIWFAWAYTWSKTGNSLLHYYNGVSVNDGAPVTYSDWAAGSIGSAHIGVYWDGSSLSQYWYGYLCHVGILNRPATTAELLQVYSMGA